MENSRKAILLLTCKDRKGLVSGISNFVFEHNGNIVDLDEHVDADEKIFSIRIVWDMDNFAIKSEHLSDSLLPMVKEFNADWKLFFSDEKIRTAVFVSKHEHCLHELLWRMHLGEFSIEIPLIISNHDELKSLADYYQIPFYYFPITKENKLEQERKQLRLLDEFKIDSIILARYMQILSKEFVEHYKNKIINIHHSFLPAFVGGNPYKQAYQRGVKIIGATAHYVTEIIDEGPIIEQDIIRITHRDSLSDLVRKGRDLERLVLARAVRYHSEHRILVRGNKTIIFE
ncbi:formyltetrahydrofolate deformylase [Melioribacteraceae bacterium 4301-Me]|uniref:formyltetrahydrofolate deformylase n=1 Tax=Pyranulibacter aquaticus TaxID=3163344 RepID=UPI00359815E7